MFNASEFVYDGVSSAMYGLMIYDLDANEHEDVSFGNKASIVEARTAGRIQPLHYGVKYHEDPLQFKLIFGAEHPMDRYELEDVALWLTGTQSYRWLEICQPDMDDVQFYCIFTELKPLSVAWLPVAFEAYVTCDCSYAYSYPFRVEEQISGTKDFLFRDEGTVNEYMKPLLTFTPASGTTSLRIVNHADADREFRIDNLPSGCVVEVDNRNGIIRDRGPSKWNLYPGFKAYLNFFRTVHGDNRLTVTGSGLLVLEGRFLRNVAG